MRSQFDDDGMRPDVGEVVAQVSDAFKRNFRRLGPIILIIILGLVAATGFYSVGPGEVGVVRTFGQETAQTGPGLHYRFPFVQQKDVVNVEKIHRIEVGYRGEEPKPEEARMLTGDENIVEAQVLIQYRIAEPSKFLFHLRDGEDALHKTSEVALRSSIGTQKVDDILTAGRSELENNTKRLLQKLMDEYESGLLITEVKLQDITAPGPVKDAFDEVQRAREDREKLINEANGYKEDILPKARGKRREIERAAEAYKEERILRSKGDAAKFVSVFAEYKEAKQVTRDRLYLETVERIFSRVDKKVLVDEDVTKGAVPILPLGNLGGIDGKGGAR